MKGAGTALKNPYSHLFSCNANPTALTNCFLLNQPVNTAVFMGYNNNNIRSCPPFQNPLRLPIRYPLHQFYSMQRIIQPAAKRRMSTVAPVL